MIRLVRLSESRKLEIENGAVDGDSERRVGGERQCRGDEFGEEEECSLQVEILKGVIRVWLCLRVVQREVSMKKIGVLFFMLAMGLSLGSFWLMRVAWFEEARFQAVDAIVVANRVSHEALENPDATSSGDRYVNEHRAEYLLEYSMDGKQYRHWERDLVSSKQRFRVESALGQMAPGTKVRVYVDREVPQQLTMKARGWKAYWGAILFGVLGFVLAMASVGCWIAGSSLNLRSHPLSKRMGAGVVS